MKLVLAGLALLACGAVARADDLSTMQLASGLGSVLAAEEPCGLSFDQGAIEKFINAKVPADNLNFAGTLNMMVSGAKLELDGMSASQKTANCTQVKRVAKSYGFTN
ncbi:signal recognition particle [Ochrobactrum teleogrylli]|uniref:Signal recognition particle n=2 Tax=Ochrobactrum teleogrylli TaxID=2479765 RepID=A0ABY2Y7Z5_9HYPH|nr:signal recognition particle [[Ochrobactrum] teleogrylli]